MDGHEWVLARTGPASYGVEAVWTALSAVLISAILLVLHGGWAEVGLFSMFFVVISLSIDLVRWRRNLAGVSYAVTVDDLVVSSRRGRETYPLSSIIHVEVLGAATWRGMVGGGWMASFPVLSLVTAQGHHTTPRVGIWGRDRAEWLHVEVNAAVARARGL